MDGLPPHVSVVPRVRCATKRRHVSFAAVRTKRRGATPDARNTAASAPSWTVHCRMFPSCRASVATRDGAMRSHCGGLHCALPGTGRHEWRPYGALPRVSIVPRNDDTFPLRPVCTKRRGATPDARNAAAPAPSWTVHRRMSTLIYAVNEGHRRKKIGRTLAGSAGMRKFGAAGKFTPEKRHPGRRTMKRTHIYY